MNTPSKVYAMIVAAGRGSRFGGSIAKQYLLIQGQTLLQHSVARLAGSGHINECLLVTAADDRTVQTLDFALPVRYTTGGAERWQSVLAGLEAIIATGAKDSDLVLIHDAARPAVPLSDIDAVIDAAMLEPYGAILATPVADTLKQSQPYLSYDSNCNDNPYSYATNTIERTDIWQAQTPQVFRVSQLREVLSYVDTYQLPITDEASAFEHLKRPIRLVNGSRQNIKLTYPDDALLIAAILELQR